MLAFARQPAVQPVEPPELDLAAFIRKGIEDAARERKSPVRFVTLLDMDDFVEVPGIWRPNALRGCQRKQVYKVFKTPKQELPPDADRQEIFDRGHVLGAWVASLIKNLEGRYGISNVRFEGVCHDPATKLGGKFDIAFDFMGFTYLIEVKSKEDARRFDALVEAEHAHTSQLNDYMAMLKVIRGWVVYAGVHAEINPSKSGDAEVITSFRRKIFPHKFSPQLWEDTKAKTSALDWFVADPTRLAPGSSKKFFECRDCPYKWACDQRFTPAQIKQPACAVTR